MTQTERALVALLAERRALQFDPWQAVTRYKGVDFTFHAPGKYFKEFDRTVRGMTSFTGLRVSLELGMTTAAMRLTLAHEQVHLERGPVTAANTRNEEIAVERIALQRLIDPVLFDAFEDIYGDADDETQRRMCEAVLEVDLFGLDRYRRWRETVQPRTATRAWKARNKPIQWPPRWVEERRDYFEEAARWTGLDDALDGKSADR